MWVACGFNNGAVSVALVFSPWGLKRIPYYSTKIIISNSAFGHRKKLNTTHTHTEPANFLIGALFYISVVTWNEKTWNWCAFASHARQSRTRSLGLRNDWGEWVCGGGAGAWDFSCHVIPGAFLCYCDRCLRAVMGEMRVVISAWGRTWGEE